MSVKSYIETIIRDLDQIQEKVTEGSIEDTDTQLRCITSSLLYFTQAREFNPGVQVWYFDESGEAYDACMSRDCIDNGDVVVILKQGIVGVLIDAWPTAVTREHGALHTMSPGYHMNQIDDGKFCRSFDLAASIANHNHFTVA